MNKVPKLRFKEFSGDWEFNRLYKVCEINPKTKEIPDKFYYIDLESVVKGKLVKDNIVIKEEAPSRAQRVLSPKDTLFQTVRPYQNNNYYFDSNKDLPTVASTGYAQLRSYRNSEFLYHLIHTPRFGKNVLLRCTGSNYPAINTNDLSEIEIYYPSIEEQEKIASFFSLIDDKISIQGEKVEALKDYKKGMMQKIFSRELRFKDDDGRDYPEWEEKKLGECIDIITDYVAAGSFATIRENVQYKNDKDYAQLIRTVDLKSKFKNSSNFVYVDKNAFEFLYRVNLNKESIILPNVGNIGEVYFVKPENLPNENNVLAPNSILLRSTKNSNLFLYQLFNTKGFRDSLDVITSKSGQPKFNKTELKEIRLNIPTEQEQIKISKILDSIDSKIDKEQEKLDSLNEYKKGLLQKMFI